MIKSKAFGWSKMILSFLGFHRIYFSKKGNFCPIKISAFSEDDCTKINLTVANTLLKVSITDISTSTVLQEKSFKQVRTFQDFVSGLVGTYCLVFKSVKDPRIRDVLAQRHIKEFENNGWPIGVKG